MSAKFVPGMLKFGPLGLLQHNNTMRSTAQNVVLNLFSPVTSNIFK